MPYIISEHHSLYHKPFNKKIGIIEKYISKIIVKNASYVCPVSDDLGLAMQKFGLKGNYYAVPNVVDTNRFTAKPKKPNNTFNLLHISSMAAVKNIMGLLRVIKSIETKIPDFHFTIIGGNAKDYQPKAAELGIDLSNVTFLNQIPHEDVVSYFQKAAVFVLFSNQENLPCVILESFSCGTPVISTNVGGISEYFPKDFGLLIEAKNETELVNAIVKVHNTTKPNITKMHDYVVNTFSNEHICNVFSNLYEKSLNTED